VPVLLPLVDGVLLTGSPSNVEATHFGASALESDVLDPRRDRLTMALVRAAVVAGTPLFGVCRGLQEMNVALGGSLYQRLHTEVGLMDHREPEAELDVQFSERHEVVLAEGSAFADWAGGGRAWVILAARPGDQAARQRPRREAHAPDGLVEASAWRRRKPLLTACNGTPNGVMSAMPFYQRTLEAFAQACREHRRLRTDLGAEDSRP
jgi:putative glutamine amidotransferase